MGVKTGTIRGFALSAVLLLAVSGAAGEDGQVESKRDKVLRYLELSGTVELHRKVFLRNLEANGLIAAEDRKLFAKFATAESLRKRLLPVYMEHMDSGELDALIAFYSSEEGRSISKKNEKILKDTSAAIMQWSFELSARARSEKSRRALEEKQPVE